MIEIFIDGFSELCSVERGSLWQIAQLHTLPAHFLHGIFLWFFLWIFSKKILTTRWWQDHIRIFWIGCDLGDPTAMSHKGTTTLKCFSHFFFILKTSIHVCSLLQANQKGTTKDSAASTVSHLSTLNSPIIGSVLTDAMYRMTMAHFGSGNNQNEIDSSTVMKSMNNKSINKNTDFLNILWQNFQRISFYFIFNKSFQQINAFEK